MASVISSEDVEMHSASEMRTSVTQNNPKNTLHVPGGQPSVPPTRSVSPMIEDETIIVEKVAAKPSLDLLDRIPGMYRLLDLVTEQGSNGLVDKVLIAQDSVSKFANQIQPGSYRSEIQVDFRALDKRNIKPKGVYGSISAVVEFLNQLGCIDAETHRLLLMPRDEYSGVSRPTLRPGLYAIHGSNDDPELVYIVFWPEDGTWDDRAISSVSRNRVTFMRYLTKLCEQVVCLISEEHASGLVWKDETEQTPDEAEFESYEDRLFKFKVEETNEEEESAKPEQGFIIRSASIEETNRPPHKYPKELPLNTLTSQIIVGETSQAILQRQFIPEEIRPDQVDTTIKLLGLRSHLEADFSPRIILADTLDQAGLNILLEDGKLWDRCGSLRAEWKAQSANDKKQRDEDKKKERSRLRADAKHAYEMLEKNISVWITKQAALVYPFVSESALFQAITAVNDHQMEDDYCHTAIAQVESWLEQHNEAKVKVDKELQSELKTLETSPTALYSKYKQQLLRVLSIVEGEKGKMLSKENIRNLVGLIMTDKGFEEQIAKVVGPTPKKEQKSAWFPNPFSVVAQYVFSAGAKSASPGKSPATRSSTAISSLPHHDDIAFSHFLQVLAAERKEFIPVINQFEPIIRENLRRKITRLSSILPTTIEHLLQVVDDKALSERFDSRRQGEEFLGWQALKCRVQERLNAALPQHGNGVTFRIESITKVSSGHGHTPDSFRLRGCILTPAQAGIQYTIHPLDIKSDDIHAISADPNHICQPTVRVQIPQPFVLPLERTLRFMRLLEKDRCLAVIEDHGSLQIYLESVNTIAVPITHEKPLKRFYTQKVGRDALFAVDESKRLFVMVSISAGSVLLHVYQYDVDAKHFGARGSTVNITKWYQRLPILTHLVFVAGSEELLLIEKEGRCRIFSLVTENFRPSKLQVSGDIQAAFSSSDGACLFMQTNEAGVTRILCHHWASFGSSGGIEIAWPQDLPQDAQMAVSSVGTRTSTHVILVVPQRKLCMSLRVHITRKSSEFAFRSTTAGQGSNDAVKDTINNSLIDCHAEVWTRFPVLAPIHRETNTSAIHYPRTVTFVSSTPFKPFASYFASMVREFEQKTCKPTKGILGKIKISGVGLWDPRSLDDLVTELQAGDWLVGLFCLIPIHLAVTGSNRFIPLKDGVISPQFEQSLLGANVAQIAEALSFGWYESIFSSYLASKPVKVVTSMGEQSVGKSFALNHFVDTSFAGSAMRCTEGVWLSVTPTRECLVVAMDFEGVHSIERSAQEDTLLVLLNCAISNLVLFRNNFALSRDIAGLFTSFQSCTKVLDPASNRSLFQSTLGIIIKDVIDSDTKEVVHEFRQKFHRIVQQERGDNFISKLHRGNLDIMPWPVIQSRRFYDLFGGLKVVLDQQEVTQKHAGAFLTTLKMLMAKLKANDWGALDQNLSAQRCQLLGSVLHFALALGTTDLTTGEPLKNYDTDEPFENQDTTARFHLDGIPFPPDKALSLAECLKALRGRWQERSIRFSIPEQDFLQRYSTYLQSLAEVRIKHVHTWLVANTSRFGEKAEVTSLLRSFDALSKELRRSVLLCGSKCSSCGLLCLASRQHEGDHNCMTSHRCPESCGFIDEHEETVPPCGLAAGHTGRHVCSETPHLCGLPCHLLGKSGCYDSCTKPMNHDDEEEHLCSAGMHTCGEMCSLVKSDGTRICDRPCTVDCRFEHNIHTCDRALSCPLRCQLCKSYCTAGDHFHALEDDAIHLCGQEHACDKECELAGVCEIATTPQSIESTFIGRLERFQYTKYTQEAKRLPCIIPIAADRLDHDGPHIHSTKPDAFHYCEERCTHCGYYCTLPLHHPQNEHDTSHGSMSHTEWVIEGNDDAYLELHGRRYAAGDSGAPMLCSLLCKSLGRHVHVDKCRPDEDGNCAGGEGIEHIAGATNNLDWITHRLFWAKSGFGDPYPQTEQAEFELCDHRCGGEEHDPDKNEGAVPSWCTLPLFHPRPDPANPPPLGHISYDGHSYNCKNPVLMQRSFHVFFVLDRSGSMYGTDRRPLPDSPATDRIASKANNRFGAVVSSLYAFWTARFTAIRAGATAGLRRDAYSIITFGSRAVVTLRNDTMSDPDQLLDLALADTGTGGGTNYTAALHLVQQEMEDSWIAERSPVIIFLSDGECGVMDETVYDLCRSAIRLGKPLAFHTISFGHDVYSQSLRRMATIAAEVHDAAPRDPLAPPGPTPCSYSTALDTVQLASTFLGLAESLKNPRAALSRI